MSDVPPIAIQKPAWSRPETFGAWVRLNDRTLIAVDHVLAKRLGVPSGKTDSLPSGPLEAHLSLTSRCHAPCTDCYLDAKPDGIMPSGDILKERILALRNLGASTIAFGGGEPLLRDDLHDLATYARSLGLVPVLTTSGLGLHEARIVALQAFAQINVSHDGVGGGYAEVRGFDGEKAAERAIALLVKAGIAVGANVVVTRESFVHLLETAQRIADLGAGELQLLRFKPRGRAARLEYLDKRLSPAQLRELWATIQKIIEDRRLSVRIDCALVPLLSEDLSQLADPGATLASLGVFGCEAARHLGAIDTHGHAMPCSFATASADPNENVENAWVQDDELAAFRMYHAAPAEPCRSCPLFVVCRGGCQVVSRHAGGAFGPDPECPQVRAYQQRNLERP